MEVPAIVRGSRVPAEWAVRCQLRKDAAVRCKRIQGVGRGSGKARQRPRGTNAEDRNRVMIFRMPTVLTEQLRRECNTREQGHQGNYFTDSLRLATACCRGKRVADYAKH